jgi:hypothetical protein
MEQTLSEKIVICVYINNERVIGHLKLDEADAAVNVESRKQKAETETS